MAPLGEHYEIVRELGKNAAGATYLARDARTGLAVVAKVLRLGSADAWKTVELFEREAAVLQTLRHPGIPAYVDSFREDEHGDSRFVLVREYIEGRDLQEMVDTGWRGTEEQIRRIGARLADIVLYIHSLRPPVIHRDINPRNIVAGHDGEIFLVDFGGVQDAIRIPARWATTMIGTPGYAPLEQFVGRATVRSDLYGLAATLVFLLTRASPADLPTKNMKLDFAFLPEIASAGLAAVLANWLEPDETARTLPLAHARDLLAGTTEDLPAVGFLRDDDRPPFGSRIRIEPGPAGVHYSLPAGARPGHLGTGSVGVVWMFIVGFWIWSAIRMRAPSGLLFLAIPFLAVGVGLLRRTLTALLGKLELEIDGRGVSWAHRFLLVARRRTVPLRDAGECRMDDGLFLDVGARTLRLGQGLSRRELEWLAGSINRSLRKARSLTGVPGPRDHA